jgi:hypothetical protein
MPPKHNRRRKVEVVYDYRDENGALLYQVVRYDPKAFAYRRPARNGWRWSLGSVRLVLYRLPELLDAAPGEQIFIVEGEKDVDNLQTIGLTATTNSGGGGRGKWRRPYNKFLRGRDVVILPDNDDIGRDHGQDVAASLCRYAASIRIVKLPGLPPKGDVSDWLAAGGTRETLLDLVAREPEHSRIPKIEFGGSVEDDMHWRYTVARRLASVLEDEALSAQEKLLLIIRRLPIEYPKKLTLDVIAGYMGLTPRRIKQIHASLRRRGKGKLLPPARSPSVA